MRHFGYIRPYATVIKSLLQKGYSLTIGIPDSAKKEVYKREIGSLLDQYQNLKTVVLPRRDDNWKATLDIVRVLRDYMRYLDPVYRQSAKLVSRAEKQIPKKYRRYLVLLLKLNIGFGLCNELFKIILKTVEWFLPTCKDIDSFLIKMKPDVVLITPMIDYISNRELIDFAKSCRELSIKLILCVGSWDNLTNKGIIQIHPDKILVWNKFQKKEAIRLHGVKGSSVKITGAQSFDECFTYRPQLGREVFYGMVGLNPAYPYLLYLCSSKFVAHDEFDFIKRWISAIRESNEKLINQIGIMIRPYPSHLDQWAKIDMKQLPNVIVWPQLEFSEAPFFQQSKMDYFNSIYYSVGVVGINTSAMIEASIIGKPVFTILEREFEGGQEGTIHFKYIRDGMLQVSADLRQHLEQLRNLMKKNLRYEYRRRLFLRQFIRPHGLEKQATDIVVNEIEGYIR